MKFKSKRPTKAILLGLSAFALVFSLSNCSKKNQSNDQPKDPQACFNSDNQRVLDSQIVTFTNCSSNASGYEWDFGDGTSSTISMPTKFYQQKGTYTVRMTAFGNGKQNTATQSILVGDLTVDKVTINKVLDENKNPVAKFGRFGIGFSYDRSGPAALEIDTSNITFPFSIAVPGKFIIRPGQTFYIRVLGINNNSGGSPQFVNATASFVADKASTNIHGSDTSKINMDLGIRIQ